MINVFDNNLSKTQRHDCLQRALRTQPYFYRLPFDISSEAIKTRQYRKSVGINQDFYLTEIMSDFGEVFTNTGAFFNVSLWTSFLQSLYGYDASRLLPSSFMTQEARFQTPLPLEKFDDRQFEIFPLLIKNNDTIFAEIRNIQTKLTDTQANIVLKGFNVIDEIFISERETRAINASLAEQSKYQFFEFDVTQNGLQSFVKQNDLTPRLILGFGITNGTADKSLVSNATVTIKDLSRRLSLTDVEIPVQFIAPRLTCLLDQVRYYLPLEYYWQPYATLEFMINNVFAPFGDTGFKFSILTRTV